MPNNKTVQPPEPTVEKNETDVPKPMPGGKTPSKKIKSRCGKCCKRKASRKHRR